MGTVSTDSTYTFTVAGNRSLTAVFEAVTPSYTITILIDPTTSGSVTGAGAYEEGQTATLTYTAAEGYTFSGWYSGDTLLSTSNPYSFRPTSSMTVTAKAAQIPVYTITATIDPSGSGTVTGAGQYQEGAAVTLVAAAGDGYEFSGWQEGGQTVSTDNPYTFTAAGDRAFTAAFTEKPTSRLPDGYTEVEYIETQAGGYYSISTFSNLYTNSIRLVFDVMCIDSTASWVRRFASSPSTTSTTYNVISLYGDRYMSSVLLSIYRGSNKYTSKVISADIADKRVIIDADLANGTFSVDGNSVNISADTRKLYGNLYLFSSTSGLGEDPCRLYSAQIYSGGALRGDFVPCINPSGIIGLYNLVTGAFYRNQFTSAFIAGPAV